MDANVHSILGISIEFIVRYEGRYEDLIEEAAQVTLKNGVTTVFDSWGPLQPLINVRNRINPGEIQGSRTFIAGTSSASADRSAATSTSLRKRRRPSRSSGGSTVCGKRTPGRI